MIVLVILGYILLALLILATLLLIIPFRFEIAAQKDETVAYVAIKLSWMFISFNIRISKKLMFYINILGIKKHLKFKALTKKKDVIKKKDEKPDNGNASSYLNSEFLGHAFESIKKILRHIRPRKFSVEGTIAFDDPYITGIVCGLINIFQDVTKADIRINSVFDDEIFEGKCFIQGRMVAAYIAYIGIRLYLSRPDKIKNKPIKFKEVNSNG